PSAIGSLVNLAVDGTGNTLLTGTLYGTVSFGGAPLTGAGLDDIYLAKLDPSGTHLWSKQLGGPGDQDVSSIATDKTGRILLAGGFDGSFTFSGSTITSAGSKDVFVAAINPDGSFGWLNHYGDSTLQRAFGVSADSQGNVLLTGGFLGTLTFGNNTLT